MPIAVSARAAVLLVTASVSARADAIDGDWRHGEGGHFSIQRPHITTDGGRTLEGRSYGQAFSYVVPAPEAGAGEDVRMILRDETTIDLRLGSAADAQTETWKRCDANC